VIAIHFNSDGLFGVGVPRMALDLYNSIQESSPIFT
jgi:hypothetical protein